jgi:large subunit ribosomal protein L18
MSGQHSKIERRVIRHLRVRRRVQGTAERPRLVVFRSARHIYAQLVDDVKGATLAAASSREAAKAGAKETVKGKIGTSFAVGKLMAERAVGKGIKQVCFDRGGFLYHGRVKALADGARDGGLEF